MELRPDIRIMTHSRAAMFKQCPRLEFFRYEKGIVPKRSTKALEFGTIWHACMAQIYGYMRNHSTIPTEWAISAFLQDPEFGIGILDDTIHEWKEEQLSIITNYDNGIDLDAMSPTYTAEDLEETVGLLKGMLRLYLNKWWDYDRERFEVEEIEPRYAFPVKTPKDNPSRVWDYAGGIDLVLREKVSGRIFIMDHKTTAYEADRAADAMTIPGQAEGYLGMILQAAGNQDAQDGAIIYRITRKKLPAIPHINKCKKRPKNDDHTNCDGCNGDGLGPVSDSACDTLPEIYEAALDEAMGRGFPSTDKQFAILSALQNRGSDPFLFQLERVVTQEMLNVWRDDLYALTLAKNRALQGGEGGHYRSTGDACFKWSRECPYRILCEHGLGAEARISRDPELQELFCHQDAHAELKEDSQES